MIQNRILQILLPGIALGAIGLFIGYLIYGQVAGEYIGLQRLFSPPQGWLDEVVETVSGIGKIRQKILVSGTLGLGSGLIIGTLRK